MEYPENIADRYELRSGQYGPYFRDKNSGTDLSLQAVLNTLNLYALRKAQLTWFVTKYGDPTTGR